MYLVAVRNGRGKVEPGGVRTLGKPTGRHDGVVHAWELALHHIDARARHRAVHMHRQARDGHGRGGCGGLVAHGRRGVSSLGRALHDDPSRAPEGKHANDNRASKYADKCHEHASPGPRAKPGRKAPASPSSRPDLCHGSPPIPPCPMRVASMLWEAAGKANENPRKSRYPQTQTRQAADKNRGAQASWGLKNC